jgi:hypothetical protein
MDDQCVVTTINVNSPPLHLYNFWNINITALNEQAKVSGASCYVEFPLFI